MYKKPDRSQSSFLDFNQPFGLQMNPENRWVDMANKVPWDVFEEKYAELFLSLTGNVAKPLRMALGSLIIQKKFQYSDRELVEQITENPYLQFFIGLPGYQEEAPFNASTLVLFRKRISAEMIMEVNEYLLASTNDNDSDNDNDNDNGNDNGNDNEPPSSGETKKSEDNEAKNKGEIILDATCSPVNIRYPQDISLLNESREKLEAMISRFCKDYALPLPRRYAKKARKEYLKFAKSKKYSQKKIREAIRKQLSYVRRDLQYLEKFMGEGYAPINKEIFMFQVIMKLYEQQKYMYDNKTHVVAKRIVSLSQPWLRPIVRGKVNKPVEFGAKLDISLDSDGFTRIEKISFEAYNESTCLKEAVDRYFERNGCYPKRVLVDQIYRTRENLQYCRNHNIRMSGPKLGRPSKEDQTKESKKEAYKDNVDRIAVEREFSVAKRSYGLGLITTKLEETQLASIALSVFVSNLFKIQRRILFALLWLLEIFGIFEQLSEQNEMITS